ncbi:MAG: IS3 family transposase [Acidobacteria bacterium]|nr:IS3 family transposase [Acidobacteriota bacterium]
MKYRFIESCAGQLPVDGLCRYLGVARSGYYKWLKHMPGRRAQEDAQLGEIIEAEFYKHRKTYGSPRMCDRLGQLGRRHGRRRVRRLMAERELIARKKKRFVVTTVADPSKRPAPNVLNRDFTADGPNRKWVSDITVIPTDEGDLYLATTMDLWSKRIVGWAIRETMEEELVQQAFDMAVQQRWPDPGWLHHCPEPSRRVKARNTRPTAFVDSCASVRRWRATAAPATCGTTRPWSLSFRQWRWSCCDRSVSRRKLKRSRRCSSTSRSFTIVNASTPRWEAAAQRSLKRRAETKLSVHFFDTGPKRPRGFHPRW